MLSVLKDKLFNLNNELKINGELEREKIPGLACIIGRKGVPELCLVTYKQFFAAKQALHSVISLTGSLADWLTDI
jgi:hypothetical protein